MDRQRDPRLWRWGWKDSRTTFEHYRANVRERQVGSSEAAMGRASDHDDREDDVPGYG